MKINYQKMLDETIERSSAEGKKPTVLMHCCCAPCSSYVFKYLCSNFNLTAHFYNPNISRRDEFDRRARELERLISLLPEARGVRLSVDDYSHEEFLEAVRGMEKIPEGGERCYRCYAMRLERTAKMAAEGGYDYFCTTLSVGPMKNAEWLNQIGKELSLKYNVEYLFSDFKKRDGYLTSCRLSKEYSLYRQSFCGCEFSLAESLRRQDSEN